MSVLKQVRGDRNKVALVVDQSILYMLVKGTLNNFAKFNHLESSQVSGKIVSDIATAAVKK